MKTKLFLLVLLFPFVFSCNKDDKEDIDDILASEEVDIEFEVVSDGEATECGGYFLIQQSISVVNYYNLKGELITRSNSNNPNEYDLDAINKAAETYVSLPVKIKMKAKREVLAGLNSSYKNSKNDPTLRIYVNGVVVPNRNWVDDYVLNEDLINIYIKLGYTREEAIELIKFAMVSTRTGYYISVPKS